MTFKEDYSFEARKQESNKIMEKYPSRIPIIVEKNGTCELRKIDKEKYLVPRDLTMNQFIYIIRKRLKLKAHESIFLMVDSRLCPSNVSFSEIYEDYIDPDGFLYVVYTSENTFG